MNCTISSKMILLPKCSQQKIIYRINGFKPNTSFRVFSSHSPGRVTVVATALSFIVGTVILIALCLVFDPPSKHSAAIQRKPTRTQQMHYDENCGKTRGVSRKFTYE